ncbi:MAG: Uma2 family endonuclease [Treponema sp.]|jgi:Uma2 family endonuclease|nr:Uma2 family endonuclease [Treponema sp.]
MQDEAWELPEEELINSYEEYCEIEDRVEIIDGVVYAMASPVDIHQDIAGGAYSQLMLQLKGKRCHAYIAPFDVKLPVRSITRRDMVSLFTIVQPDVFIVCDPSKNKGSYIEGAPDFIIEVLSDSTRSKDTLIKLNKYALVGVKEYWMIDPINKTVNIAVLGANNYYDFELIKAEGKVPLRTQKGLIIDFDFIFS